jgi:uncharacterized protein
MTSPVEHEFRIRTITGFIRLRAADFAASNDTAPPVQRRMRALVAHLRRAETLCTHAGYTVQTLRIATNPFGEWLLRDQDDEPLDPTKDTPAVSTSRLDRLDQLLTEGGIDFLSLGPAVSVAEVDACIAPILAASPKFYCSARLAAHNVPMARHCADLLLRREGNGLPHFRFCVAAAAVDGIPFFPVAHAASKDDPAAQFALGLENGALAQRLLRDCGSIAHIPTVFAAGMAQALRPLQRQCVEQLAVEQEFEFLGLDTSLNPSLDAGGSVAAALEGLVEVPCGFGGPGTLAAAAAVTQALQSLPGIRHCGYSGIMLPVCEDVRLAELTASNALRMADLLSISQVCGVGIDTVPIAADEIHAAERLTALLLDVAGLAHRWQKSLSCRVLPVVGKRAGERTQFDSPYLVNAHILSLAP